MSPSIHQRENREFASELKFLVPRSHCEQIRLNGAVQGARLSEDRVILELKFRLEMPALFKQLVEEFALNPQPVSKYRLAVIALGFVPEPVSTSPAQGNSDTSVCLSS